MKKITKLLSIILVAIIFVTTFSVSTFALTKEDTLEDFLTNYDYCLDITSRAGKIHTFVEKMNFYDGMGWSDNWYTEYQGGKVTLVFDLRAIVDDVSLDVTFYEHTLTDDGQSFKIHGNDDSGKIRDYWVKTDKYGFFKEYREKIITKEGKDEEANKYTFKKYLDKVILFSSNEVAVNYGETCEVNLLPVPGTKVDSAVIDAYSSDEGALECYTESDILYIKGNKRGTAVIDLYVNDVLTDICHVEIEFNFFQWILYIVFFGWIWM